MNKQSVEDGSNRSGQLPNPSQTRALLSGGLPERRGDIVKYARQIETLYVVARRVSSSMNMHDMLNSSLAEIVREMDADAGAIYIIDDQEKTMHLKARTGRSKEIFPPGSVISLCGDELSRMLQWKQSGLDALRNAKPVRCGLGGTQELATAPLVARSKVHGILLLGGANRQFTRQEIELLESACSQIAVGIENIQLFETTRRLAITDELTGLCNRRHFYEVLQAEILRSERYNHRFSIALLDLDRFKNYNDTFGHGGGDKLLTSFARTLKQGLRKTDAGFRYGGDEFALILPLTQAVHAKRVVSRIRGKWDRLEDVSRSGPTLSVGFSAGIAQYPEDAATADNLILIADAALYQCKRLGKNSTLPATAPSSTGRSSEDIRQGERVLAGATGR